MSAEFGPYILRFSQLGFLCRAWDREVATAAAANARLNQVPVAPPPVAAPPRPQRAPPPLFRPAEDSDDDYDEEDIDPPGHLIYLYH